VHWQRKKTKGDVRVRRRKQTLFYAAAVAYLRDIFEITSYHFRDDFAGDLIIHDDTHILCIEIKSESEVSGVSTTSGKKFKSLRTKINALPCLSGQNKGWLAYLAQPFDYMNNDLPTDIENDQFSKLIVINNYVRH